MNKLVVFILILFWNPCKSQDYFNRLIDFTVSNPNPLNLIKSDSLIYIASINFIEEIGSSTIITHNLNSLENTFANNVGFAFTRNSFYKLNDDNLCAWGTDKTSGLSSYVTFNNNLSIDFKSDFNNASGQSGSTSSLYQDDFMYGVSIDEYDNGDHIELNIKKINPSSGALLWSKNFGENDKKTFGWDIDSNLDNSILLSTTLLRQNSFSFNSQLISIDNSGNENWRYIDEEGSANGSGQWVAALTNENIVISSFIDKDSDLEFITNEWYTYPPKLSWISSTGTFIDSTYIITQEDNWPIIANIKSGLGDYFWGFGHWFDANTEEYYGWIFKMSNEGDMLWSKRYQHWSFVDQGYYHSISDLIEEVNGDIYITGNVESFDGDWDQIWLMKLNEHGCFGDEVCSNQLTSVASVQPRLESIKVYPNPTTAVINLEIPQREFFLTLNVYNRLGQVILNKQIKKQENNIAFDFHDQIDGLYYYSLTNSEGKISSGSFVLNKNK